MTDIEAVKVLRAEVTTGALFIDDLLAID